MIADPIYIQWLSAVKSRFHQSQIKAAVRVNSAMLEFYWSLGRDIVVMKAESNWGSGFFNQLSLDLKELFPNQAGFSTTNLKYMKRWYEFYNQSVAIRQRVVDELQSGISQQLADDLEMPSVFASVPWFHHVEIMTKCASVDEALFYIGKVVDEGWSRNKLEANLKAHLFDSQGRALNGESVRLRSWGWLCLEGVSGLG